MGWRRRAPRGDGGGWDWFFWVPDGCLFPWLMVMSALTLLLARLV